MNDVIYIVETYDYEGESTFHLFYFTKLEEAKKFGKAFVNNDIEEILGYNVLTLESK